MKKTVIVIIVLAILVIAVYFLTSIDRQSTVGHREYPDIISLLQTKKQPYSQELLDLHNKTADLYSCRNNQDCVQVLASECYCWGESLAINAAYAKDWESIRQQWVAKMRKEKREQLEQQQQERGETGPIIDFPSCFACSGTKYPVSCTARKCSLDYSKPSD